MERIKKVFLMPILLFLLSFLIILIPNISAEIIINEFESNPAGTDTGNEWVELYSNEEINLTGWQLMNGDNDTIILNCTINGYLVINFTSQWLDNSDEKILLLNNGSIINETPLLSDTANNNLSWNFCGGEWQFLASSIGNENQCESEEQEDEQEQEDEDDQEDEEQEDEEEPEDEQQEQENQTTFTISLNITEKPLSMKFGEIAIVKAKFFPDKDYKKLLFLLYSAPKRVVRDINESVITPNRIGASTAVEARAYAGNEIEFSLPLNLFDNCNKYYDDSSYEIFLRAFYFQDGWESLGDLAKFSILAEYNKELCEGIESDVSPVSNLTALIQEQEATNPKTTEEQTPITGAATKSPQSSSLSSGILYLSKSKTIKNIGLWILVITTLLLFFITWKKKLI